MTLTGNEHLALPAVRSREYDGAGRETVRRFLYTNRNPIHAALSERSIVRFSYNAQNLMAQEASFDANDQPVDRKDEHWFKKQWQYDSNGRLERTILQKTTGEVVPSDLWRDSFGVRLRPGLVFLAASLSVDCGLRPMRLLTKAVQTVFGLAVRLSD